MDKSLNDGCFDQITIQLGDWSSWNGAEIKHHYLTIENKLSTAPEPSQIKCYESFAIISDRRY